MNTDNKPKTDNISDETSAKLLRLHIEDARHRTDNRPAQVMTTRKVTMAQCAAYCSPCSYSPQPQSSSG